MIEYFKTYWYLFVILFAMIMLTLFVGKKALVASSKRREEMNRIMEKAKRAKELRDAYRELTPEIIANAPAAALAEGIALCLESACQKTEDTDGFYDSMTDGQKKIYALYYLISDANENSLSTFFKSSYRPLTSDAVNAAKKREADVLIVDTAGRLHNKKNLMDELAKINRVIARELPDASRETLLVLDATTGQNAIHQAKEFKEAAEITGLILTKLDGTAKGGIVLTIKRNLGIPVKFIGVGEGIDDMKPFDADEFAEALFS